MKERVADDLSGLPMHGLHTASLTWWGTLAFMLIEGTGFALALAVYLYLMSIAPTWPLEMLSIFTFESVEGGKTTFTVRWSPHNATEEERKTFDAGHASMNQGWSGTMDQLEAYLAKANA